MRHPYWARREIARLDPVADARRIAHLVFEVRYGAPVFVHPLFALAFARQVAVPDIARVLYRDGRGLILSETARRNDDTLVFFGLLFRHGDSPEGQKIVDRITRMHARFPIANDLNLYTLATLACLPSRIGRQFMGRELLTPREATALYHFWRRIGRMMGIRDIPGSPDALLQWMLDYEASEYRHTRDGQAVTVALAREFAQRWFPSRLQNTAERLFYATFDDRLLATHQLPSPTALEKQLVATVVRGFVLARQILPDPPEQDLVEMFGRRYGARPHTDDVGPPDT